MDCYRNFEYYEKLKRRHRVEQDEREEEEQEIRHFCNPAFRLEVKRQNDAAVFDCKCDEPEVPDRHVKAGWPDRNLNAGKLGIGSVRKTSNSYMIRWFL